MKNLKEKTDSELVMLSLKDPDHFGQLVDRYEKKLSRYAWRISGLDAESLEDILQETFIKTYLNLNDYNNDFSFSSWIYKITHNETVSYLRKNKKLITVPLETEDEKQSSLIEVLKNEIDVEAETRQRDIVSRIQKAMDMLPDKYREVLVLRYSEDMDYREISDILKMPMGTVATTINRAKEKFKEVAKKMHLNTQNDG
ncbi:MAG: RNA polymerase sigma factor [Candidatus Peregrinibacteria bacterium]|nr:RNA polymerase sigma factor [Candidatus Peregrinibacteria bacterium]